MNATEYERMFRLEDSYWWFVGRHQLIRGLMRRTPTLEPSPTILDIGCGTGAMSQHLARMGTVVSADYSQLALSFSRRRGLTRLCGADAMRLPFQDCSFDAIVALDILEHLSDDAAAASEFSRVLKPGGIAYITVPAYRSLWSGHDLALMHHRRYVAPEIRTLMTEAGLTVRRLSYAMTLLCPIVWLVRRVRRGEAVPQATLVPTPGPVNRFLACLLSIENAIVIRHNLPFGVTVACVAAKPHSIE